MTLLNAPEFDERKENRNRNILVGSGIFIALLAVLTVGGFMLGHGWLFMNLPTEHHVKVFLSTVESGDYSKAYGIWNNDPNWQQHPQKVHGLSAAAIHRRLHNREHLEGQDHLVQGRLLQARRDGYVGGLDCEQHNRYHVEVPARGWDAVVLPL